MSGDRYDRYARDPRGNRDRRDRDRDRDRDRYRGDEHRSHQSSRDYDRQSSRRHDDDRRYDRDDRRDDRARDRDRDGRHRDLPPRDRGDHRDSRGGYGRESRDYGDASRDSRDDRDGRLDPVRAPEPRDRSRSPVRPREPTPDLDDVVPILERKRQRTLWDAKPPGYDNVTAEQAKMSGLFALPGQPRNQQADPEKLKAFAERQNIVVERPPELHPSQSRQARRLLITRLPPLTEEAALVNFFNNLMFNLNTGEEGRPPCLAAHMSREHGLAIADFRSAEETTLAMAYDGVTWEGSQLQIRRPQDYITPEERDILPEEGVKREDGVMLGARIPDTPHKVCIRGLPAMLGDEECISLLSSVGELKSFGLVKDRTTDESRGIAFCEWRAGEMTDVMCQGLDGTELGDTQIRVGRACTGAVQTVPDGTTLQAISSLADSSQDLMPSRVLMLFNLVTGEEIGDRVEHEEICDNVRTECTKFGAVRDLKVPQPASGSKTNPGVGKVYVRFEDVHDCERALTELAGRKFADRTILTTFYPEENYEVEAF